MEDDGKEWFRLGLLGYVASIEYECTVYEPCKTSQAVVLSFEDPDKEWEA